MAQRPFERHFDGPPAIRVRLCGNCRVHLLKARSSAHGDDLWCYQCGARTGAGLDHYYVYRYEGMEEVCVTPPC